jgi:hypothetical protein
MLKRRRFRHGAEAAGDEFGGVVERGKALARLQDEHAGEGRFQSTVMADRENGG